jgi:hypothetical protein
VRPLSVRSRPAAVAACCAALVAVAAPAHAAEPGWGDLVEFSSRAQHPFAPDVELAENGGLVTMRGHTGWGEPPALLVGVRPAAERARDPQRLGAAWQAELAGDGAGGAIVAWPDASPGLVGHVRVSQRRPGTGFTQPVTLHAPADREDATGLVAAAIDGRGASVVVFASEAGNETRVWAARRPAGGEWGALEALSEPFAGAVAGLDVAISDQGEVVAVWDEGGAGGSTPRWARAPEREPFAAPVALGPEQRAPSHPRVAADARGGAVAVWYRGSDPERQDVVASIRPPGGAFGAPQSLGRSNWAALGHAGVAVADGGGFAVAFAASEPYGTVAVARGTTTGALGAPQPLGTGWFPLVAVAPRGETLVSWRGEHADRVAWWAADGTGGVARDVACASERRTAALAAGDGRAALLWRTSEGWATLEVATALAGVPPRDLHCSPPPPGAPTGRNPHASAIEALMSPPPRQDRAGAVPAWANGASTRLVFSQDNRRVRLMAFESDASNLVAGDPNGVRDVFVVRRDPGGGVLSGQIERASVRSDERPANGPSRNPSLDGETRADPHCVAFESRATNLDRRDRTRDLDVYVRDLRRGRTALASAGRRGARNATIDGRCQSVVFESGGSVWVAHLASGRVLRLARGTDPDQQTNGEGVAYVRDGQVRHRRFSLARRGRSVRLRPGRERLVSDAATGRPGNGVSSRPVVDDAGHYVAFESTATDLCRDRCAGISEDANGPMPDVFRRTLSSRAPTRDAMQMVSFSHDGGEQGNGPSRAPAISGAGENVVFVSEATNLRRARDVPDPDGNGTVADVHSWTFPRARGYGNVTRLGRLGCHGACTSPSEAPSMSSRGNYVGYAAAMTEFCVAPRRPTAVERPCTSSTDVFVRFMGPSHEGHPLG